MFNGFRKRETGSLLFYFFFLLFLDLGIVIFCGISQANLLKLNVILVYFER